MNPIQMHMLSNHLPIVGFAVALVVLVGGFIFKSRPLLLMGAFLAIVMAIPAFIADKSGEEAEELVEDLPGVNHKTIHEHEEAAELTLTLMLISAGIAVVTFFLVYKEHSLAKFAVPVLILVGLAANVSAIRTGHLGGNIRHPELEGASAEQEPHGAGSHEGGEKGTQPDGD